MKGEAVDMGYFYKSWGFEVWSITYVMLLFIALVNV